MPTGAKMRVYEIAKELNVPNKELIARIRALGMPVNNHMSSLDMEDVNRIRRSYERERLEKTETKRLSSTVLRRRSKSSDGVVRRRPARDRTATPTPAPTPERAPSKPVVRRSATTSRTSSERGTRRPAEVRRPTPTARPSSRPVVAESKPTPTPARKPEPVVQKARPPAPEPKPVAAKPAAPAAPAPVESRPPAEKPAVESKPAAAPAPVVAEAKPVETTAPATPAVVEPAPPPAPPAKPPKTNVFITGPRVVRMPGQPEPEPPPKPAEPEPRRVQTKSAERRRRSVENANRRRQPTAPKRDIAQDARSRFEQELARARARVSEREETERKKRAEEAKDQTPAKRDPNRPAVGSIISLPIPRIKVIERATPTRQMPNNQIRGRFANSRGRGGRGKRDFNRKRQQHRKGQGKQTQITVPAEHKRVIRMEDTVAIPELAKSMGVKAQEVLKKLWTMGMVGVNINASIDHETAQIIAAEFGYEVQNVAFKEEEVFVRQPDDEADLVIRSPVVTVMGHVDHGKTSLLDRIRSSRVAAGEAGGITQHVAAYKVSAGEDYGDIVFLDTPGHEAFTEMRARGAQATDIVVLVVAANDGVMPQTVEAVNHAKDAKVTIIVAVNKCDLPDAQPERVRQQLAEHGLIPEEWGGDTLYMDVSALKGDGIPELLESISLTAELLELKANPNKPARGIVIEAKLDRNRGPMATILVQEGTLRTGTVVVAGRYYGKVRAMLNDLGKPIKSAGPSTPIELLGLDGVPEAGEILNVADDEKVAKQVVEHRRQAHRKKELATTGKISLENLMERIQEGETHELKIVLKADVQGSAEAIKAALLKQSTEKVKVKVISAGVGGITETDVNLAKAGGAIIVGFHVRPAGKSAKLAERENVEINLYDVIYEALEDVRKAMAGLLDPIKREESMGKLEVRETFTIPKVGTVAGCMVTSGKVLRRSLLRVVRDSIQIYEGRVGSLKRFKDDTTEVKQGFECGLMVQGFNDIKVGDIIESYEIVEEAAEL